MDAYECLVTRGSVRQYNGRKIEKDILEKIVYAGQCAPTGMNRQPLAFVVVQDEKTISLLSKLNAQIIGKPIDPFYGCSAVIVVFASSQDSPTYLYDGALAMGNLMNGAHALGVSSCWIHRAKEVFELEEGKALMEKWGLSSSFEGIGNCILGYSDVASQKGDRTSQVVWVCE